MDSHNDMILSTLSISYRDFLRQLQPLKSNWLTHVATPKPCGMNY